MKKLNDFSKSLIVLSAMFSLAILAMYWFPLSRYWMIGPKTMLTSTPAKIYASFIKDKIFAMGLFGTCLSLTLLLLYLEVKNKK